MLHCNGSKYSHKYPQQELCPSAASTSPPPPMNVTANLKKPKPSTNSVSTEGSVDCVLGFVKHHLTADPERSDIVHDLLAFLAEQMVEMNKAKGEEIRGFLRYLEREIGVEIDMHSKTRPRFKVTSICHLKNCLRSSKKTVDPFQPVYQTEISKNRWSANLQIASPHSAPCSPAFSKPTH